MIAHLKYKDNIVAKLDISEITNTISNMDVFLPEFMPYLRDMSLKEINFWWKYRAIPDSRKKLHKFLNTQNCEDSLHFLIKNLALSLTDCYWICPIDMDLKWDNVNLFNNTNKIIFKSDQGEFSNNPNCTLTGTMGKEAIFKNNKWILKKYSETNEGEQCINETFANLINYNQNFSDYVIYNLQYDTNRCIGCSCPFFTDINNELITAYNFTSYEKQYNDASNYEHYIKLCSDFGLDENYVRSFMDYQTLLDFVLTNTDRHYLNFGVIRDTNNLKIKKLAPIYDCGNSMFYNNSYNLSAYNILNTEITGMAKYEEKMLSYVKNKNILDIEKLPNKEQTKEFYICNGLNEQRADAIANNYQKKIEMLNKFQKGYSITRYTVKNWNDFLKQDQNSEKEINL